MCDYISMFNNLWNIFLQAFMKMKKFISSKKQANYKGDEDTIFDYIDEIAANINSFT